MNFTLNDEQQVEARLLAIDRNEDSKRRGLSDAKGLDADEIYSLRINTVGAAGEMAVAMATGEVWHKSVGAFGPRKREPDVGVDIQVRTRTQSFHDLLVRKDDDPNQIFFLVICDYRKRTCEVVGWLKGKDAMKKEFSQKYGGRPKAYFVPREHLHPVESYRRPEDL